MGKLKVSNNKKKIKGTGSKGNSGIPNWLLTTILVVLIAAMLSTFAFMLVTSTGIVKRASLAMGNDDFKVDGAMMQYYYVNTYQSFVSNYSSYMTYFSLGSVDYSVISNHNKVVIGGADGSNVYDSAFVPSEYKGKTWFEYFMDQTQESVKSMLLYCMEAKKLDKDEINLTEEDKNNINEQIDLMLEQVSGGQLSDSKAAKYMFGDGVKKKDIRKAMELSTLASNCAEYIHEEIIKAGVLADDGKDIYDEYKDNGKEYDLIDYVTYTYTVKYDTLPVSDILTEDDYKAYKDSKTSKTELDRIKGIIFNGRDVEDKDGNVTHIPGYKDYIADLRDLADALAKSKTVEEYKENIYRYALEKDYEDTLQDVKDEKDEEKKKEDEKADKEKASETDTNYMPSAEDKETIKTSLLDHIVKEILDETDSKYEEKDLIKEKDKEEKTYTLYGVTLNERAKAVYETFIADLFTLAKATKDTANVEGKAYVESDDFCKWAFDDRKDDEITKIIESGDKDKDIKATDDLTSFSAKVYYLTKPQYKDTEKTQNIGYMVFEKEDDAKAAIKALEAIKELDEETFVNIAVDKNVITDKEQKSYVIVEDYVEGKMQETVLDTWLYGDDDTDAAEIGDFTKTPLKTSSSYYMIAYYISDGNEGWYATVRDTLINDRYTEYEEEMDKTHSGNISYSTWTIDLLK